MAKKIGAGLPLAERLRLRSSVLRNGCVFFIGAKNKGGYGTIHFNGRPKLAHRAAYELKNGPVPKGKFVCHSCDNPWCINPDHLFVGTAKDNTLDCIRKGRRRTRAPKGESHYKSKLTLAAVSEIRTGALRGTDYARKFGVSSAAVSMVKKGRTWNS